MTKLFILLTGYFLLSQPTPTIGQPGKEKSVRTITIYQQCCEKIMKTGPCLFFTGDHNGKMKFRLLGIYAHGPTLFFLLRLNNRSSLDYAVDSIRFCVAATGHAREGARGSKPLQPVYVYDSTGTVTRYQRATTIYAVPRFTLSPGRRLQIMVWEKNGGRHLRVQTTNSVLQRARFI